MMDAKTIIDNPNISLYCIDDQHKRAIFVETTSDIIARVSASKFVAYNTDKIGIGYLMNW